MAVNAFWVPLTFITLAMLVVGGQASLAGAVVGVITITATTEIFRQFEKGIGLSEETSIALPLGVQEIVLGVLMLLILTFRPAGIMAGHEIPWPFGKPKIKAPAQVARSDAMAPTGD